MTDVTIAGWGITDFGRLEGKSVIDLAVEASRGALAAVGKGTTVDAMFLGTFAGAVLGGQNFSAAITAARLGLDGVPVVAVEAACASGSVALRQAINAIRAGEARVVLVVGAEKLTASETPVVTEALARANDTSSDSYRAGLTFPGFFALLAQSYLRTYGVDRELLADVAVKNRRHGMRNPHAQFRAEITPDEALSSRPIADPLRLFDCSPISDGGAALVVASLDWAREHCEVPVTILACEQASGPTTAEALHTFTSLPSAARAAAKAYERAGIRPADIDVAEVHDCFTIAEWIALEDLGIAEPGRAPAMTSAGDTTVGGRIPVNPSGGLLAKGHPIGATGVAQVIEVARQICGEADNQVEGAAVGLTHNVGGTGGLASVTILARAA